MAQAGLSAVRVKHCWLHSYSLRPSSVQTAARLEKCVQVKVLCAPAHRGRISAQTALTDGQGVTMGSA